MSNIKLMKLSLKNFKGIKDFEFNTEGKNIDIYGENGKGKTTIFDAFVWLLFDKDSHDRVVGDKEANFQIKTLDSNSNVIHGLEHSVTGSLNVNGKIITLSKIYKEKWTKKRGEAEKKLTGHETLYYINEVPAKLLEYKAMIGSLIDENLFKLISNPLYFSSILKWQDRRKTLMDIIEDIKDDNVIEYNSNLKPLTALLNGTDIDSFRKLVAARKKKLNDDIKSLPYRIDECNNSIKDLDFEALNMKKQTLNNNLQEVEEKLLDNTKISEERFKLQDRLFGLQGKLKDIEYQTKVEAEKPKKELENQLLQLDREKNKLEITLDSCVQVIKDRKDSIDTLSDELSNLKKKWYKVNSEALEIPEDNFICPVCKRPFEEHDIEAKKQELADNFNQDKANRLKQINENGKGKAQIRTTLKAKLEYMQTEKDKDEKKLQEVIQAVAEKKKLIDEFKPVINLETNVEYQKVNNEITELQLKLSKPVEVNAEINSLKIKKNSFKNEIEEINSQLAYKKQNKTLKARIAELQEQERKLAEQIATLEGQEYLCEEFIKAKVELLESSINSKFKYVKFKLFDTQVNGALVETCEALCSGVPFSNANTASQINAGLDIINALCKHYEVSAPIFIDRKESVNKLIKCESQIINLIVSTDKNLRIESEEN